MKFDQVCNLLLNYQTERNERILLLSEDTQREIYHCIVATKARDCLELRTGFGATTCVMAAAIEEIGGGTVPVYPRRPAQRGL
jgi:predicted O-methyltransferase YrrM